MLQCRLLVRGRLPLKPRIYKTNERTNRKIKDENKSDLYLKIRVSQEEMNTIKRKFQNSGMETLSGFVRAMIFEGYIVQMTDISSKRFTYPVRNC